jgi:hypothetical protein
MPVEILTASLRREWERFPEEIDEATLSAFFSFADDELELIAGHRGVHGRFAIAVAVGAVRWLGFVPAPLEELPSPLPRWSRASSISTFHRSTRSV